MSPILPKGERADDPPEQGRLMTLRFRLALAARKYPIQLAVLVSLAVLSYPVVLLINAKNDLEDATQRNRALVVQTQKLAVQTNKLTRDFQAQRIESIRSGCEAQNAKNIASTNALIKGSNEDIRNAPNAAVRKETRRRRDVTLALLNALSERRDCARVVREATRTPPAKPTPTPTPVPTITPVP